MASTLDHVTTPLNACSLEIPPKPIVTYDERRVWPVIIGCYQLHDGYRRGRLALYVVDVKELKFGRPLLFPPAEESDFPGVLDGKWCPVSESRWYAIACASGEIKILRLELTEQSSEFPFELIEQASSVPLADETLCLSLNWLCNERIVSSYSNGQVVIHSIELTDGGIELRQTHCWLAHSLFGNIPTQVWTTCFLGNNMVASGGDDGTCKLWDLSELTKPSKVLKDFEAGVTVVSLHPRRNHILAIGSYDESLTILDLKTNTVLAKQTVGGGIWRISWHPLNDYKILLAVMHGGCRLLQLSSFDSSEEITTSLVQKFTLHKSMAYGAAWLVAEKDHEPCEAAASCSFYDNAAYLWDTADSSCN